MGFSNLGSISWRIRNYGFLAATRYLFERNSSSHKFDSSKAVVNLNYEGFIKLIEGKFSTSNVAFMDDIYLGNIQLMESLRKIRELNPLFSDLKDVVSENASIDRLISLWNLMLACKPRNIVETGTQYGVSAASMGKCKDRFNLTTSIKTFDVEANPLIAPSSNVEYHLMRSPVRKSFIRYLKDLPFLDIFFHDSDHSYENMTFEFAYAWDIMKCNILLSDDIDNNYAFADFCRKRKIVGYRVMIDKGPALGLILR